jgi:hypothetical protein
MRQQQQTRADTELRDTYEAPELLSHRVPGNNGPGKASRMAVQFVGLLGGARLNTQQRATFTRSLQSKALSDPPFLRHVH